MSEPEVALVFTADAWVEELHRHLTDHGGARVRQLVVEPSVALEESYDVLVASHRWPALTHAFVADIHATGRLVLGVYDRDEPAGLDHLKSVEVDQGLPADSGPAEFVATLQRMRRARNRDGGDLPNERPARTRIVAVGGVPGVGRTEVAIEVANQLGAILVDADDVAPAVAQRLGLPIEPNLRTAIDAVEHARGDLDAAVMSTGDGLQVVGGLPNPRAWAQVRPGEVVRVVERLGAGGEIVVDGLGSLEDIGPPTRGRNAIARALVLEAALLVVVCDASPVGVSRVLGWAMDARSLAAETPMVVVVNHAPAARFRRAELYEEITRTLPVLDVVFTPHDRRVTDAAWNGTRVGRGGFTKACAQLTAVVRAVPAATAGMPAVREAS